MYLSIVVTSANPFGDDITSRVADEFAVRERSALKAARVCVYGMYSLRRSGQYEWESE
jgi:hypothetical protein